MHLIRIGRKLVARLTTDRHLSDVITAGQFRNNRGNQCAMAEILLDLIVCKEPL
jgi:hypothetical protein